MRKKTTFIRLHPSLIYPILFVITFLSIFSILLFLTYNNDQKHQANWTMIILIVSILILVAGFSYSLFKISIENRLRKETQIALKKREVILKRQNAEYASLNRNYKSQNEKLQIAKEKSEESDRLKSAFLANMSHEIRTPMNGILGFTKLLKEVNLNSEDHKNYIDIIERSGARLLNIINDIIDISKIESGQMNVTLSTININDQTLFKQNFFKKETQDKGLQFSLKNELPSTEALIFTDCEKVYTILTNLVKNAIKYTDKGFIEFGYKKEGDFLEFFVKDTGIGIPKHRHKAIFERFIQVDYTDKMARQGAGLGLSIAKAYTEMLGGKIWVESQPGKGSIFYFTIPYVIGEPENKPKINDTIIDLQKPEINNLKILIAEDDAISRKLISMIVKPIGKEILLATTGLEAVEICQNNNDIDLILMDIQMPEMDGYEATKEIRKFNKKVIIVAQTAFALEGDREKMIATGCNDYIPKPIKKEEISRIIHQYFSKHPTLA